MAGVETTRASAKAGVETTRSPMPLACVSQGLDHTFRLAQFCSPHEIHPCRSGRHCPAHCLAAGTFSSLFSSVGNTKNSHYPVGFFPCVKENGSLLQVGHRLFRYRDLNLARPAFLKGVMINTAALSVPGFKTETPTTTTTKIFLNSTTSKSTLCKTLTRNMMFKHVNIS